MGLPLSVSCINNVQKVRSNGTGGYRSWPSGMLPVLIFQQLSCVDEAHGPGMSQVIVAQFGLPPSTDEVWRVVLQNLGVVMSTLQPAFRGRLPCRRVGWSTWDWMRYW